MSEDFRSKSRAAQEAISRTLGGRVIQASTISAVIDSISRQELENSILLLGNKVIRQFQGRKFTEFNLQVEFDSNKAIDLIHYISEVKEDDPRGLISQSSIQKVLGGSDPLQQSDLDPRAARKVQAIEKKWSLEWIGLVPRRSNGLPQVLNAFSAFSLTEQRMNREVFHREHQGGAFLPYMLKEEFREMTGEEKLEREEYERSLDVEDDVHDFDYNYKSVRDFPSPWTDEFTEFIDKSWKMFFDFGFPGIREMITAQFLYYNKKFKNFNCEKFCKEWEEKMNEDEGKLFFRDAKPFHVANMYAYWLPQMHCSITALEENIKYQTSENAKNFLRALLEKLTKDNTFVTKDKIPFERISRWFKEAGIPYVIKQKVYNDKQSKWKTYYLPHNGWKENIKKENCVYVKLGIWNGEHYFYWRDNVNEEYNINEWPNKYKERLLVERKPSTHEIEIDPYRPPIKFIPPFSCGRLLNMLVEKKFVVPITGVFEEYSGLFKEEPEENLCDELEHFYRNPHDLKLCCVPDRKKKYEKKLGVKRIPRECIFAGDTESFIDPETGIHTPSLIVIKGIYRDDLNISLGIWESDNPIRDCMKIFLRKYTKWVIAEIVKKAKLNHPAAKILKKRIKEFPVVKSLKQVYSNWISRVYKIEEIFDKKLLSPRIYFHNLGYDVQAFITQFSPSKKKAAVKKDSVWYSATFKFVGVEFILLNSFTIITTALKNFPKMFLPKEEQDKMKKEVYAYDAINQSLLDVREQYYGNNFIVSLENMEKAIEIYEYHKTKEEKAKLLEELWKSASEVDCLKGEFGEYIDIGKYSKYYCERDVDLLSIGLKCWEAIGEQDTSKNTFKGMPPFRKFDVYNFLSAPAIAQTVTEAAVRELYEGEDDGSSKFFPEDCTYKYRGRLRKFMLHCTTGGRCTLANEKRQLIDCCKDDPKVAELIEKSKDKDRGLTEADEKYLYQHLIQDFDARSLYPTAMSRSFIPIGMPEVVYFGPKSMKTDRWIWLREINKKEPDDGMYVITDIEYDKHLAMPVNCWKQEKPEPRCRWNNDVPKGVMQLRKLTDLKTMMYVQGAHFRVLGGLEWKNGKCTKIQQFMKDVYAFRRLNHSNGFDHPIQEAAKLIMNSFYGKNVTKIRETEELFFPLYNWRYISKKSKFEKQSGIEELLSYIKHNWTKIKQIQFMEGCYIVKKKCKDDSEYDVNFGCEVLAGSRAVICPVSAMVEQITGKPCLYTDTDSLHLFGWQVDAIANAFQKYFGIPMIGGELGQFHVDFEPRTFRKGEKCLGSSFFCGVGKKMYIDELRGSEGSCEYHRRAKGIRAEYLSKEEYLRLYYGETIYKDLDKCGMVQIRQKDGHNMSVHMVKQVKATAFGETEVMTDIIEEAAEDLIRTVDDVTEDEDLEEVVKRTEKRGRENQSLIQGNEDDTIEIIEDPESECDEPAEKEARIEIL